MAQKMEKTIASNQAISKRTAALLFQDELPNEDPFSDLEEDEDKLKASVVVLEDCCCTLPAKLVQTYFVLLHVHVIIFSCRLSMVHSHDVTITSHS